MNTSSTYIVWKVKCGHNFCATTPIQLIVSNKKKFYVQIIIHDSQLTTPTNSNKNYRKWRGPRRGGMI